MRRSHVCHIFCRASQLASLRQGIGAQDPCALIDASDPNANVQTVGMASKFRDRSF